MIPLFVGYAMLVWALTARHRRQVAGFCVVLLGFLGLVVVNYLHSMLNEWTGGRINLPVLRTMMYPYTALVVMGGMIIACLPRRSLVGCYRCAYDLDGLDVVGGAVFCPECGEKNQMPAAYRRSGVDRDNFGASDRVAQPSVVDGEGVSAAGAEPEPADDQDAERESGDQPPAEREQALF